MPQPSISLLIQAGTFSDPQAKGWLLSKGLIRTSKSVACCYDARILW